MRNQQTLAAPITCSGIGLHSGQPVTITLRPAPVNTGVVFVNRNGKSGASLPASIEHLVPTELCTAINGNGFQDVESVERRDQCMRQVPRRDRADGVIILSLSPRDEDLPYLQRSEVPIVQVDANHPSLSLLNRVIVDDVAGGRTATQHLIELGHRRIGYISDLLDSPFNFTSSRDRFLGYRQALDAAGIPFRPEFHGQKEHGRYEARLLAEQMLALSERPTAIFAASDTQAMGVLEAARNAGLHVPEDLSVIGYDDIEIAEYLDLTVTIHQLLYESGQLGVELMLDVLEGMNTAPVCRVLPTELIIRGTTVPPTGG